MVFALSSPDPFGPVPEPFPVTEPFPLVADGAIFPAILVIRTEKPYTIEMNEMARRFRDPDFCLPGDIRQIACHVGPSGKGGHVNRTGSAG